MPKITFVNVNSKRTTLISENDGDKMRSVKVARYRFFGWLFKLLGKASYVRSGKKSIYVNTNSFLKHLECQGNDLQKKRKSIRKNSRINFKKITPQLFNLLNQKIAGLTHRIILADHTRYVGEGLNSKPHGFGHIYANENGSSYSGEFKEGLYHGYGKLCMQNGDSQDGLFENGEFVSGFMVEKQQYREIRGSYQRAKPGWPGGYYQGIINYTYGSRYEGGLMGERPDREGIFTHVNGARFKVSHRNGIPDGPAVLIEQPKENLTNPKALISFSEETDKGVLDYQEKVHESSPRHSKFLKSGEHYLELTELKSTNKGQSFGTFAYHQFIETALSLNFNGHQIVTDAVGSSHLFHLYMGMRPQKMLFGSLVAALLSYYREHPGKKIPLDQDFGSFLMTMSEEGLQRWKEIVANETLFTPFKNFEHLQKDLADYRCEREKLLANDAIVKGVDFDNRYPLLEENALEELFKLTQ